MSELIVSEPDFVEAFLALPQTGMDDEIWVRAKWMFEHWLSLGEAERISLIHKLRDRDPEIAHAVQRLAAEHQRQSRSDDRPGLN